MARRRNLDDALARRYRNAFLSVVPFIAALAEKIERIRRT